jgi:hypothetical protein
LVCDCGYCWLSICPIDGAGAGRGPGRHHRRRQKPVGRSGVFGLCLGWQGHSPRAKRPPCAWISAIVLAGNDHRRVTIATERSEVRDGKIERPRVRCDGPRILLTFQQARKSGGMSYRRPLKKGQALPRPDLTIYGRPDSSSLKSALRWQGTGLLTTG